MTPSILTPNLTPKTMESSGRTRCHGTTSLRKSSDASVGIRLPTVRHDQLVGSRPVLAYHRRVNAESGSADALSTEVIGITHDPVRRGALPHVEPLIRDWMYLTRVRSRCGAPPADWRKRERAWRSGGGARGLRRRPQVDMVRQRRRPVPGLRGMSVANHRLTPIFFADPNGNLVPRRQPAQLHTRTVSRRTR